LHEEGNGDVARVRAQILIAFDDECSYACGE
jgi:hypothetical protein